MINPMIICQTCQTEYESFAWAPSQAPDCSAIASTDGVNGYFGSTLVDMEFWQWTTGKPIHIKIGDICDKCIQQVMDSGALKYSNSNWG